jgi:hypothetical protein
MNAPRYFTRELVTNAFVQDIIERVRAFESARRGCNEDDIAWFPQLPIMAAPGRPVSYSSVLASPECIASASLSSALTCMELCLSAAYMDVSEGAPALGSLA